MYQYLSGSVFFLFAFVFYLLLFERLFKLSRREMLMLWIPYCIIAPWLMLSLAAAPVAIALGGAPFTTAYPIGWWPLIVVWLIIGGVYFGYSEKWGARLVFVCFVLSFVLPFGLYWL